MMRSLGLMAVLLMPLLLLPPLLAAAQGGGSNQRAGEGWAALADVLSVVFVAKERIQAPTDVARWKAAW